MNKHLTLLSIYKIDENTKKRLEKVNPNINIIHTPTVESMESYIEDADIVMHSHFNDELLRRAKKLSWFQSVFAGFDHLLTPGFVSSDILLTSAKGNHPISVSEHAFALLLALSRNIYRCFGENNILDKWHRPNGDELYGKTAGILGMGQIGRELAIKAKAFGMKVKACDSVPVFVSYLDQFYETLRIEEFFSGLDVLFIALAANSDSQGMVNRMLMEKMNPGCYLINVSRGVTVNEKDLVYCLQNNIVGYAGLDVFVEEPLSEDNELRGLPNVVLTPHLAGLTPRYEERVFDIMVENFRRWQLLQNGSQASLINVVNKQTGS